MSKKDLFLEELRLLKVGLQNCELAQIVSTSFALSQQPALELVRSVIQNVQTTTEFL